MRVPPSQTVAYQRPDHRLRPSTGTLIVTGLCIQQGVTKLDQKTPDGPKDCPAESWSRWDTNHFTPPSVNGIEERGSFFKSGLRPPTRDQMLPFNIMVFDYDYRCNGWILFCCKMVRWHSESQIHFSEMQSRCDSFCLIAFLFYPLSCQNLKKHWFI